MDDLTEYRLNSYSEICDIKEEIGEELFNQYLNRIYRDLSQLGSRAYYPIQKTWIDIDIKIRIKICCLYILEQDREIYQFDKKYNLIIHK